VTAGITSSKALPTDRRGDALRCVRPSASPNVFGAWHRTAGGRGSKTCLVTGASRGIGRGISERFGEDGCEVAINYRTAENEAEETVARVEEADGSAIAAQADVTDLEEVRRMRDRIHEAFGPVDVLVNNADITQDVRFTEMTHEE
jgi:3-oxoacyl-[acyl-carrier protein] reductase